MNEKIVILGNGFDLRHFLPTKYNHLITILREIESFDFSTCSEIKFDDLFGNLFKEKDEWFYEKICEYYNTDKIVFNKDNLISIQQRLEKNNWFKYLKTVEDSKIETWIDFETEIERVLNLIVEYFENFNNNDIFKTSMGRGRFDIETFFFIDYQNSEKFFDNRLQFKILLNFDLFRIIKINPRYYSVNEEFILEIDNQIQYYKEKVFFNLIYFSLEQFTGIFNDYIECIINVFYDNFKEDKAENFIKRNAKFLFDNVDQIYSFNYTKTKGNLFRAKRDEDEMLRLTYLKNLQNISFIHGTSIKDWKFKLENLQIVLGVSEIDKSLKSHKLFQFTKYFQKLHKNTDYLFLDKIIKDLNLNYKGQSNYTFYFWGHSLDSSDSEYIKDIFKVLSISGSDIKIFYHSISGKADQLKNLLNIIEKDTIEDLMKNKRLTFIESSADNLFAELS